MRIEHNNVLRVYENAQKTTKPESGFAAVKEQGGAKTDRISFSSEAAKTSAALRDVKTDAAEIEGAVSQEKLQALTKQISEGTYNVPADKIAGAMLNILG